jgi:hypothetical protein
MSDKIYKQLRVIEYVGTLDFINEQKIKDTIKGTYKIGNTGNLINSAYIGESMELYIYKDEELSK